jgi:hypothetical protein
VATDGPPSASFGLLKLQTPVRLCSADTIRCCCRRTALHSWSNHVVPAGPSLENLRPVHSDRVLVRVLPRRAALVPALLAGLPEDPHHSTVFCRLHISTFRVKRRISSTGVNMTTHPNFGAAVAHAVRARADELPAAVEVEIGRMQFELSLNGHFPIIGSVNRPSRCSQGF